MKITPSSSGPSSPDPTSNELFDAEELVLLVAADESSVAPSPRLFERIAATTQTQPRFERFADDVAALLDVPRERALTLLQRLDDGAAWEHGFFPGMVLQHAVGGPAVSNAITGFVRLAEGAVFPEHEHLGDEQVLVLQGRCQDGDAIYGPGDRVAMATGSAHSFSVCPGPDLMYLAVVHQGLRVGQMVIGPEDPRA
jgi:putative transcriptional regulator